MEIPAEIAAARAKLREKPGSSGQQIGGKGSARRKTKKVHKSAVGDERKIQQVLKRIGTSNLADIEEVRMIKEDGNSMIFEKPKVQAAPAASTYVVNGTYEERKTEIVPNFIKELAARGYQMGSPQLEALFLQHMQEESRAGNAQALNSITEGASGDDVPAVLDNFDDVAKED